MARLSAERRILWRTGMAELPDLPALQQEGRNGEELATDEAAVWKRVLNYRLAQHLQPARILETHAGIGVGTALYRHACSTAQIDAPARWQHIAVTDGPYDLIDIDPFGQPYDCLNHTLPLLAPDGVLCVSNGEALAVGRNLRSQRYPTTYHGRQMWRWVTEEYLPRMEMQTGLRCQFFYGFPTTVRAIFASTSLPIVLWRGCPQWMWWLAKYAPPPRGGINGGHLS